MTPQWDSASENQGPARMHYTQKKDICVAYLVVDLKFLDHSQLHEHPQGGRYHGIDIQGEVVEGELVYPQLADEGDVGGLSRQSGKRFWRGSEDSVPFLEGT